MEKKNKYLLGLGIILSTGIICGSVLAVDQDKTDKTIGVKVYCDNDDTQEVNDYDNWIEMDECDDETNKANMYNDNNKIAQVENNYSYAARMGTVINNVADIKYSGFYGINTICFLDVKEDTEITVDYDSTVSAGKFKEVLVNPNNEVETIVEGTEKSSKVIKLPKGKYMMKNVGANTQGTIKITFSNNPNVTIIRDDND